MDSDSWTVSSLSNEYISLGEGGRRVLLGCLAGRVSEAYGSGDKSSAGGETILRCSRLSLLCIG